MSLIQKADPSVVTQFDILRLYDQAIQDKFQIRVDNQLVPLVPATRQRAFANVSVMFNQLIQRVPLPSGAMVRGNITPSSARNFFRKEMTLAKDMNRLLALVAQSPKAVDISYSIGFKAKTQAQGNELKVALSNIFVLDNSYVNVPIPDWGTLCLVIKNSSGVTDSSESDPGNGERVVIVSCEIVLEGFTFRSVRTDKLFARFITTWEEMGVR